MVDASPTGGAVIMSPATISELRAESKHAHRSGWTTITNGDLALVGSSLLEPQEVSDFESSTFEAQWQQLRENCGVVNKACRCLLVNFGP